MRTVRRRLAEISETLERLEDLVDGIHFRLFEERGEATAAERYFDERRRDPDYDHAYRTAWRTIYGSDDGSASGPESPFSGPQHPCAD